jgi:hypothetical protein
MRLRIVAIALVVLGTAASGQVSRSPVHYQAVSEVPGGFIWYLNTRSVRPAGPGAVRFWITGDNRGAGATRRSMRQVKLVCGQPFHIPLRVTNWDAAGTIIADTSRGDDDANWISTPSDGPVAAARAWVCR